MIGSPYTTPYNIHITAGVQHAFNNQWLMSADYVYEDGVHGYRAFPYTGGLNLTTPLIPESDPTMPPIRRVWCPTSTYSRRTTVPSTAR